MDPAYEKWIGISSKDSSLENGFWTKIISLLSWLLRKIEQFCIQSKEREKAPF